MNGAWFECRQCKLGLQLERKRSLTSRLLQGRAHEFEPFGAIIAGQRDPRFDQKKLREGQFFTETAGKTHRFFRVHVRRVNFVERELRFSGVTQPLMLMGIGLPLFFVPVTALAPGCVEEHETASAAGLQNFLRTLSGAVATSIVTTAWEDKTSFVHAEFTGFVDRSGETARSLGNMGMNMDAIRSSLDNLLQGQSVMVATNQLMATVAIVCGVAAFMIWLAPKPARAIDMTKAGH